MSVCVREREREREVCVCVRERERECVCVCVNETLSVNVVFPYRVGFPFDHPSMLYMWYETWEEPVLYRLKQSLFANQKHTFNK